MAPTSVNSVAVAFTALSDAFEFVSAGQTFECRAYISMDTGEIHYVSDGGGGLDETPEDIEDSDRYIGIPHKNDLDLGRALVLSFVRQELPDEWQATVDSFRRRGAYGRFKQMLDHHAALERWYQFEAEAIEKALRAWAEDNGVDLAPNS
jgi:hypothetical protein